MESRIYDLQQSFSLPEITSFPQFILDLVRQHGDRVAFIDATSHKQYTFGDVYSLVARMGSALRRRGVARDDVVCLYCANSIDYAVILLAVTSLGAIVTTANPMYTIDEIARQLSDTGAQYIFVDEAAVSKALTAASRHTCKTVKGFFVVGRVEGMVSLDVLYEDDGSQFACCPVNPATDVMTLLYSSGTTGLPKGVMSTHNNYLASTLSFPGDSLLPESSQTVLLFLAQFHMFGFAKTFLFLARGDTVVIMHKFDITQCLYNIQLYKVTTMPVVPPIAISLSKYDSTDKFDLTSLHYVICAAALLSLQTVKAFQKKMGVVIQQTFGATELTGDVSYVRSSKLKPHSVGQLVPTVKAKVIDSSTGRTLPPNEIGELCFRGKNVTKGYWHNETATRQAIDDQEWYHTGDLGYFDNEGYIFVTGRLKEIIKCNAFQIAPAELEGLLLEHPAVKDVAVIGVPDPQAGQLPKAFVVRQEGLLVTEEDIVRYVHDRVISYKRLKGGVTFVDEIPKLPSGKILRRKLVEIENAQVKAKI